MIISQFFFYIYCTLITTTWEGKTWICVSPHMDMAKGSIGWVQFFFFFLNKNLKYTHKPSNTYDHKVKSNIFLINKFELIIFKDKFKSLSALYQVSINCITSPLFKINHLTWELPHEKRNGDCRHAGRDPHVGLPPRGTFLRSGGIAHRRTRVYHRGGEEWIQFNKYKNNIVIHTAGHTGLEGCVPISLKIPISVRGRPLLLIITVLSFFLLYFFCFLFSLSLDFGEYLTWKRQPSVQWWIHGAQSQSGERIGQGPDFLRWPPPLFPPLTI